MRKNKCIWCGNAGNLAFGVCEQCRKAARRYVKPYKAPRPRRRRRKRK